MNKNLKIIIKENNYITFLNLLIKGKRKKEK